MIVLHCDGRSCAETFAPALTEIDVKDVRALAAEDAGWMSVERYGVVYDYCSARCEMYGKRKKL